MPLTKTHSTLSKIFLPPPAVLAWTGKPTRHSANGLELTLHHGAHVTLAAVTIEAARTLQPGDFADRVTLAYQAIDSAVASTAHAHIVRWWNGVPGIHDRVDDSRDRYMAFNAGRFAALRRRYGDASLADEAPAASGVGIAGDALVIHALAAALPGKSMQNARQRPAVRYSSRFGPLPPCFARATRTTIDGRTILFISGTASILGEETVHHDDLDGQMNVTLDHLNKLVADASLSHADVCSLRAYLPVPNSRASVESQLRRAFPEAEMEFFSAALCRRDLLVEVECIARSREALNTGVRTQ